LTEIEIMIKMFYIIKGEDNGINIGFGKYVG